MENLEIRPLSGNSPDDAQVSSREHAPTDYSFDYSAEDGAESVTHDSQ